MTTTAQSQKCNACGQEKVAAEFHRRRGTENGLAYKCKACTKEYDAQRDREYSAEERARKAARQREREMARAEVGKLKREAQRLKAQAQPRQCRRCEVVKEPQEFGWRNQEQALRHYTCKACLAAAAALAREKKLEEYKARDRAQRGERRAAQRSPR